MGEALISTTKITQSPEVIQYDYFLSTWNPTAEAKSSFYILS